MDLTSNRSMTAAEAAFLLQINGRVKPLLTWDEYVKYVRRGVARPHAPDVGHDLPDVLRSGAAATADDVDTELRNEPVHPVGGIGALPPDADGPQSAAHRPQPRQREVLARVHADDGAQAAALEPDRRHRGVVADEGHPASLQESGGLDRAQDRHAEAPEGARHHPLVAALPMRWRFYRSGLYISPLAPLLLGMGLRQFSMHPSQLLEVKQQVMMADAGQLLLRVGKLPATLWALNAYPYAGLSLYARRR